MHTCARRLEWAVLWLACLCCARHVALAQPQMLEPQVIESHARPASKPAVPAKKPVASAASKPAVGKPAVARSYAELMHDALAALERKDFTAARSSFVAAHALEPSARTLRGMGLSALGLKEYKEAVVDLEQALASSVLPLREDMRAELQPLLERAYSGVGRFVLRLAPANTRLLVDRQETGLHSDERLLLATGSHELEASAGDFAPERRKLEVVGGENSQLAFSLRQLPVEPVAVAVATPEQAAETVAPADAERPEQEDLQERRPGTPFYKNKWVWLGVGVTVIAIAVTTGVLAAHADHTRVASVSASANTPPGGTLSAP